MLLVLMELEGNYSFIFSVTVTTRIAPHDMLSTAKLCNTTMFALIPQIGMDTCRPIGILEPAI